MALALRATATTIDAGQTASLTITLPANSAGDLLLLFVCNGDQTGSSLDALTLGWSKLAEFNSPTGGGQLCAVFAKRSNGSESNPTIRVGNGTLSGQLWAVVAQSWQNDAAGPLPTVENLSFVEDVLGPQLDTAALAPALDNSALVSGVFCDQSAGASPQIGSQSASSGNTLTKDADVTGGGSTYCVVGHEMQTSKTSSSHTYNYTGGGTAARGAAMLILSLIIPAAQDAIAQVGTFDSELAPRAWF